MGDVARRVEVLGAKRAQNGGNEPKRVDVGYVARQVGVLGAVRT